MVDTFHYNPRFLRIFLILFPAEFSWNTVSVVNFNAFKFHCHLSASGSNVAVGAIQEVPEKWVSHHKNGKVSQTVYTIRKFMSIGNVLSCKRDFVTHTIQQLVAHSTSHCTRHLTSHCTRHLTSHCTRHSTSHCTRHLTSHCTRHLTSHCTRHS